MPAGQTYVALTMAAEFGPAIITSIADLAGTDDDESEAPPMTTAATTGSAIPAPASAPPRPTARRAVRPIAPRSAWKQL